jgi:hypothetical protein
MIADKKRREEKQKNCREEGRREGKQDNERKEEKEK